MTGTASGSHHTACCRAMVMLLATAPAKAGAALAPEVYSGHVDLHQRLLVRLQLVMEEHKTNKAKGERK